MKNHFTQAVFNAKTTENGAIAYKGTGSALLDLYGTCGALRSRDTKDIENKMELAWAESPLYTTRIAFLNRDVRGGNGEREVGRTMFRWIAKNHPEVMRKNLSYVPEMGRWDDIYTFIGTPLEEDAATLIHSQARKDLHAANSASPVSLMAKWLKSCNTSSRKSCALGRWTARNAFGVSEREYRKYLSFMREYLEVIEQKMSSKKWDEINYPKVPSNAMNVYHNAFKKHDEQGFQEYLDNVAAGEEKINAGTLYPYNLTEKYMYSSHSSTDEVIEAQWKALPSYVSGENNILVMADVSGSMMGRPMATSVGLAVYFAERNHGAFQNKYMTFSSKPEFIEINPNKSLYQNIEQIMSTEIGYSTDLDKAMKTILSLCVKNSVPAKDMPKAFVIISDNEIDNFSTTKASFFQKWNHGFAANGYELPKIVFWNVDARQDTFLALAGDIGAMFISGQSASTFKRVLESLEYSPVVGMLQVLNSERYAVIEV